MLNKFKSQEVTGNNLINLILNGYLYSLPSLVFSVAIITKTRAAIATNHTNKIPIMVMTNTMIMIKTVIWKLSDSLACQAINVDSSFLIRYIIKGAIKPAAKVNI